MAPASTAATEATSPRDGLDRDARFLTTFTLSLLSVFAVAPHGPTATSPDWARTVPL
jgi:hypothetical protein